jgi:predicted porin
MTLAGHIDGHVDGQATSPAAARKTPENKPNNACRPRRTYGEEYMLATNNRIVTAVLSAILASASVAHADDVGKLIDEAATLKKQNEALERCLDKLEKREAVPARTADSYLTQAGAPLAALAAGDGPLTYNGVTLFGAIDAGLGWASYGLPINGKFYLGNNLLNKNATHSYFGISPSNLSQTALGVKGATELAPGLSGVFYASTGINPQSGQLANAPGSIVDNNGLNRNAYSLNGDGSRGGQAINDQLYVGLASKTFGQLTFGRHKSLTGDMVGAYDPAGAAYAFSVIGYSGGPVAGLGDTESGRLDDSLKYRVEYGPVHAAAIYKFADGNGGCNYIGALTAPKNTAQTCYATGNDGGQIGAGFNYASFDFDGVLGYFHQAVSVGPLNGAQAFTGASTFTPNVGAPVTSIGVNANTLTGTISDNTGWALAGKYTYGPWKFYAGWAHVIFHNPSENVGVGAQNDQGGYSLSTVNNAAFPHAKLLDTLWLGARYAYDAKTEIFSAFYMERQNGYGSAANLATCALPAYIAYNQTSPRSGTCAGNLYGASAYVDYHFTKRFDVYGGLMYTSVTGGIASGYFSASNWAPTVGARFTF